MYLFSVRIFIPPDEAVSGKFVAVAHVVGSDGCSGKRGCFRYSSIEEDNVLDSGTAKGKWITKYVRFRTDSDAEYFYPLVISDVDNSEGTFFVDDFKLERQ